MRYSVPQPSNLRVFTACLLSLMTLLAPMVPVSAAMKSVSRAGSISTTARLRPAEAKADTAAGTSGQPLATSSFLNPFMPAVGPITATKVDQFADSDADGKAELGETINYTVTVTNTGSDPALGVVFNDTIDPNTTLVPNSLDTTPLARDDAYTASGNIQITIAAPGVLANDADFDGDTITASAGATSTQGGNVTMSANGGFTYNPPAGFEGTDSFDYTINDGDGHTNTGTVTFTVSDMIWFVNNNASSCTTLDAGCGRLSNPFSTLAAFQTLNNGTGNNPAAGDDIFLYESATAYTGPVTLLNNQRLIGQDATDSLSNITGVNPPAGSLALPAMNSGNGTIVKITSGANAVSLTSGATANLIRGLTIGNTTNSGINGTNFGTLTLADLSITDIGTRTGQALNLTTGTLSATIANLVSSSAVNGISLTGVNGTLTINAGALSNLSGADVLVSGGNANITFPGTINNTSGRSIDIQDATGGTKAFSGAITDSGQGIFLDDNANTTINFTGGLALSTTTNAAFTMTDGGTVSVTQNNSSIVNTVTTSTGSGVIITDATIGSSGVAFRSINTNGAPNGINLSNTGNTGGSFTVMGNTSGLCGGQVTPGAVGTPAAITAPNTADCSGGTIQNSAGANGATSGIGIRLNNARNISLTRVRVTGSQNFGIYGNTVSNITINSSFFDGTNGNDAGGREGGAAFDNLTGSSAGSSSITNSAFTGSFTNGLRVSNTTVSSTLNSLVITGSQFTTTNASGVGEDGIQIEGVPGSGSLSMTVSVTNSYFNLNEGDHFNATPANGSNMTLTFQNNTLLGDGTIASPTTLGGGITLNSGLDFTGQLTFNVSNNTIRGTTAGSAININKGGAGLFSGTISNNAIGQAGVPFSGCAQNCSGINLISQHKDGELVVAITNNNIRNVTASGIRALIRDTTLVGPGAGGGNTSLQLTATSNNISEPNENLPVSSTGRAINVEVVSSTDVVNVCADIGGAGALANTIGGTWNGGGGTNIRVLTRNNPGGVFRLPGYGGAPHDEAAVAAYLSARNNGTSATGDVNPNATGPGFTGGGACTSPLAQLNILQPEARDYLAESNVTASGNEVFTNHGSKKAESVMKTANKRYGGSAFFKPFASTAKAPKPQARRAAHAAATLAPMAAMPAGENINFNIGTLPAGETITIKFSVTVNDPFNGSNQYVSNQANITGSNFAQVNTDDPAPPAGFPNTSSDPTITPVDAIQITISDAMVAEGAVGDRQMVFTLTLSNPAPAAGVSVNYTTANNTAVAGPTPAGDYTNSSGTATVTSGNLTGTFSIPVHGDTVFEGNETFFVNLSGAVNGTLLDTQAVGTIADDESQPADFDGDGLADASIWGSDFQWRAGLSGGGNLTPYNWGSTEAPYNDIAVPGDYDGDNKTDFAVWRPSEGNWYIVKSGDGSFITRGWGAGSLGDIPVPGDYDGDGKTDIAVWRAPEGNWYVIRSSNDTVQLTNWGGFAGDIPVPADYDGDGKTDAAVFRPSEGNWYILQSSDGVIVNKPWGISTDTLVPGDYDGDGKADVAVWRASEGNWYIVRSSDNVTIVKGWGGSVFSDVPVPADYDGDGRTDIAVWRPAEGNWYILKSSDNTDMLRNMGLTPTDKPVPSLYPPQ